MAQNYIGKTPVTGDFKKCDSITTADNTATYNLRVGSAAVYPESALHCIVQVNGIQQVGGTDYNIVNDTIVFTSNLMASDVINQVLILGNVNDIGVPSDDTCSQAKIQNEAINEAKMQISNAGSNGNFLQKQSGNTGGLTWAAASGTTINNNADNRVITGSGSANTLEGEASLTYDGTTLQPTTSGGGIKLDNLQSSNANTLDEYEEGSWTCELHNFSGTETVTSAKYMKIGTLVHCWFSIVTGSFSSDSDTFTIKTLPFTAHNSGDQSVGGCLRAWSTGTNWGSILVSQNGTSASMYNTTGSVMNFNDFGQSKTLNGCFIYLANN